METAAHLSSNGGDDPYIGLDHFGIRLTAGTAGPVEVSYRVLDSAPLGMALLDPAGRFYWANAAVCALLGRSRDGLVTTRIEQIVHPEDMAAESAVIAELVQGQRTSAEHEIRCLKPDGSAIWISASISVPTGPDGSPLRLGPERLPALALQALDITDRKAMEKALADTREELRERNIELERSNSDLDDVAAILSHDLAEPLRVIAGHVTLLADRYGDQLDADARSWIDFAVDGCTRMKALLDAVLAYSRVGRASPAAEPVDSTMIVADVLHDVAHHIEANGVRVTLEGCFPAVPIVPAELGQVFSNLTRNALLHGATDPEPSITIRALTEGDSHRFEVEDNGPGVPDRHRERIFRPFQRLNRVSGDPGTGIGLAICRRVVERAGGRIGVTEAPRGGAIFWFTIPRRYR